MRKRDWGGNSCTLARFSPRPGGSTPGRAMAVLLEGASQSAVGGPQRKTETAGGRALCVTRTDHA
jgi:hypothetical protein